MNLKTEEFNSAQFWFEFFATFCITSSISHLDEEKKIKYSLEELEKVFHENAEELHDILRDNTIVMNPETPLGKMIAIRNRHIKRLCKYNGVNEEEARILLPDELREIGLPFPSLIEIILRKGEISLPKMISNKIHQNNYYNLYKKIDDLARLGEESFFMAVEPNILFFMQEIEKSNSTQWAFIHDDNDLFLEDIVVQSNAIRFIKHFFGQGFPVKKAFSTAIAYQKKISFDYLLQNYSEESEEKDSYLRELLYVAVTAGHDSSRAAMRIIGELIKAVPNVDFPDENGNTPIFEAIRQHKISIALMLLNNGADTLKRNKNLETPLLLAFQELPKCSRMNMVIKNIVLKRTASSSIETAFEKDEILFVLNWGAENSNRIAKKKINNIVEQPQTSSEEGIEKLLYRGVKSSVFLMMMLKLCLYSFDYMDKVNNSGYSTFYYPGAALFSVGSIIAFGVTLVHGAPDIYKAAKNGLGLLFSLPKQVPQERIFNTLQEIIKGLKDTIPNQDSDQPVMELEEMDPNNPLRLRR